jgi:hypothetical protein
MKRELVIVVVTSKQQQEEDETPTKMCVWLKKERERMETSIAARIRLQQQQRQAYRHGFFLAMADFGWLVRHGDGPQTRREITTAAAAATVVVHLFPTSRQRSKVKLEERIKRFLYPNRKRKGKITKSSKFR